MFKPYTIYSYTFKHKTKGFVVGIGARTIVEARAKMKGEPKGTYSVTRGNPGITLKDVEVK